MQGSFLLWPFPWWFIPVADCLNNHLWVQFGHCKTSCSLSTNLIRFLAWCLASLLTESSCFLLDTHFAVAEENLNWIFVGFIAFVVDDKRPITLVNSRRIVKWLLRRFWQFLTTFCTFSVANEKDILIKSIFIPGNSIFQLERKIDFLTFIIKLKL